MICNIVKPKKSLNHRIASRYEGNLDVTIEKSECLVKLVFEHLVHHRQGVNFKSSLASLSTTRQTKQNRGRKLY